MPGQLPTLQKICFERTAQLLRTYWNPDLPFGQNPFRLLPSAIINTLIIYVAPRWRFHRHSLRLLLKSNRVTKLTLEDKYFNCSDRDLHNLLMDFSSACYNLISLKLDVTRRIYGLPMSGRALGCLLNNAQNLKCLESAIEFDLRALGNSFQLEKLVLNFGLRNNYLEDILLEVDGHLRPHPSLKQLEVWTLSVNEIPFSGMSMIFKYCKELISTNCDIAQTLEYLHAEEWRNNGSLTHKYKIQKFQLGKDKRAVSREQFFIASLTCPELKDLIMFVDDSQHISALGGFRNLTDLRLTWSKGKPPADYTIEMESLLQKPEMGHKLKSLSLTNFTNVDFSSVGARCPNLENLDVAYELENNRSEFLRTSFCKLNTLKLRAADQNDVQAETLLGILRNAINLKKAEIFCAGNLTDLMLEDILRNNCLSKMKEIVISKCSLSLHGMRNLVSSTTSLEDLDLQICDLDLKEVYDFIHGVNPRVRVGKIKMYGPVSIAYKIEPL